MPAPKYSREVHEAIVSAISYGVPRCLACECAGIDDSTLRYWLIHAKQNDDASMYFTLFTDIKKAEANAVKFHLKQIIKAAKKGIWTASAWWLERNYSTFFGKRESALLAELELRVKEMEENASRNAGPDLISDGTDGQVGAVATAEPQEQT